MRNSGLPASVSNPVHPYHRLEVDWEGEAPAVHTEVYEDRSPSILSRNDSPDILFTLERQPEPRLHARLRLLLCSVHPPLPRLGRRHGLRAHAARQAASRRASEGSIRPPLVARRARRFFSGVTDCYRPPGHGSRRLAVMRELADAGVPVGVNVSPVVPGLSDADTPEFLLRSREAGARWAGYTLVRLPGVVAEVFGARLRAGLPERAKRVWSQTRDCRGGRDSEARFGHRMAGTGPRWAAIEGMLRLHIRRLGISTPPPVPEPSPLRRPPAPGGQLELW